MPRRRAGSWPSTNIGNPHPALRRKNLNASLFPNRRNPAMYDKILVTLDATPSDRAIIEHIKRLAALCKRRVVLLHVPAGWAARKFGADAVSVEVTKDNSFLATVRKEFEAAGIPVDAEL